MINARLLLVAGALSVCLTGCQVSNILTARGKGTGSTDQLAATAFTTAQSSSIHNVLDEGLIQQLDKRDLTRAAQAQTTALDQERVSSPIAWRNPDNGNSGEVVSGPRYSINGRQCRDYIHTVTIRGIPQSLRGISCRQPGGAWQTVPA